MPQVGYVFTWMINLPLPTIRHAALRLHADGSGDMELPAAHPAPVGRAALFPDARLASIGRPVPTLFA